VLGIDQPLESAADEPAADAPAGASSGKKRGRRAKRKAPNKKKPKKKKPVASGTTDIHDTRHAENIVLYLPSDIPHDKRSSVCKDSLVDFEKRFRLAEMQDALVSVRKHLRMHGLVRAQYKGELGATGNSKTTKGRELIQSFWRKAKRSQAQYNSARSAMLELDPDGDWKQVFEPLLNVDLRGPYAGDDDNDLDAVGRERFREHGATRTKSSWIWMARARSQEPGAEEPIEQVRVQWSKLMAYAARWDEELRLIVEEMRRTLVFLKWKSEWWLSQVRCRISFRVYSAYSADDRLASARNRGPLSWAPVSTLMHGVNRHCS
jgi:hypothetical protein